MHQGQVLAEGTPAEIAANETVQSAYLGGLYEL
jgi:ABC-type branched-subunit amino acid transport system ATPase component